MPNIDLCNCKTAFDNRLWTINITTDFSRFFIGDYDIFILVFKKIDNIIVQIIHFKKKILHKERNSFKHKNIIRYQSELSLKKSDL